MSGTGDSIATEHGEFDLDLPPALPVGFVVGGKYRIKRVLGSGGNAAVYEGEHTDIGHRVAIKVAHRKQDDRGDVMERFRREARICGALRHPHVGQVFDVGTLDDGAPYMVLELQEGRSLADVIDETRLPITAIIDITRQLLAGLAAVHQTGAVHLDVKPDNVMLVRDHGGDVVVKLVDFGISKRLNEPEPDVNEGDERIVVGSPDYMPPEQLRGEGIDARTDLYAAGVLLYEAITGRPPFDGETTEDLVIAIVCDPVPPPSTLRTDCPQELERVVLKALSREPSERFQSADEMSRTLAALRLTTRAATPASLAGYSEGASRKRGSTTIRRRRTIDARTLQTVRVRAGSQARRNTPAPGSAPVALAAPAPSLEPSVQLAADASLAAFASAAAPVQAAAPAPAAAVQADAAAASVRVDAGAAYAPVEKRDTPVVPRGGMSASAKVGIGVIAVCVVALAFALRTRERDLDASASAAAPVLAPEAPPAPAAVASGTPSSAPAAPAVAVPSAAVQEESPAAAPADPEPAAASDGRAAANVRTRSAARTSRAQAASRSPEPARKAQAAEPPPPPAPPPAAPEQAAQLTRAQLKEAATAFRKGQIQQALGMYRQLVKVAPKSPDAWRGLAVTANRMAERAEAERALRRYLQLRPNARDAATILQRVGGGP